jgi:ABC-type dipeptide/oligopeptide/nickel transport system permease component
MSLFLLKRLATLLGTLLGASVIIFLVLEVLPGNAAQMLMGPDASPEAVTAMAAKLGLDQPAWTRYWQWIGGLLTGQLGDSHAYGSPVVDLILERLALTVPLALMAMALTTVLALLVGVTAAARQHSLGDAGLMGLAQVGIAIPNFWFAILLILVFSENHCSFTENTRISRMANQKLGMAMPTCASPIRPTSPSRLWRAAAVTPTTSASTVVRVIAIRASGTVSARRSRIRSSTGEP